MNKKYRFLFILLSAVVVGLQSCEKDYFDLNDNPNQVTTPSLSSLLSTATHKAGINNYNVGGITSTYVQYLANPSAAAASDIYQEVDYTSTWDALYYAMADIADLKTLALEQGSSEYLGVANVLLSYHLNLVTDMWGNAPFSDAFNPTTLTPLYDTQEDLYKTSLDLLDSAIVQLTRSDATLKLVAGNDLIHGGDRLKWIKTAYALKARMLIKVSKTASFNAASVLSALDNSYKSNADDAGMASFQTRNPWAQVARNNASLTLSGWLSEQLVDHLNGTSYGVFDPRIRKITDPTITVAVPFIGTVNGAGNRPPGNNTVKDENYVATSSPWTSDAAPVLLVTYAETKFIEAEAALVANPTRAYAAYLAGINANMDKLQVPAGAERTAYIAAASVGAGSLTKALIFKEKYVATYLNPEAWNDARRLDYMYKNFTLPQNAALTTFIRRLAYPTGERSKNGKNIPSVSSLTDRLWWDK
ncbi:MAG: SusD/RagB family nutrient-binding outer membrane lipoprotein [Chitinophagaceae bacterium]|nr:SusD/RagB family nutrient-binding outer membrane lipoprotein [Chitinophagaceae bacterium]